MPLIFSLFFNILVFFTISVLVCTNLIVQVSRIQGHEIRIVSYAYLDGGDCQFY